MAKPIVNNKVLLVQAPPWGVYSPPLGIAYLATFLKSAGFLTDVLDLNIEMFNHSKEEIKEKWTTQNFDFWASGKAIYRFCHQLEDLADRIISFNAGIIGFSATHPSAPLLNALLPIIREKTYEDVKIVIGGAGTNYIENRFLFRKDLIDYFIIGDGEHLLFCLLNDLQRNMPIQGSPQYVTWRDYRHDRAICISAGRENGLAIDSIPFPTLEEFNLNSYSEDLISLISSRGCIRACSFCCDSPLKKPYRCRDPEKTAEEIRHHVNKYNRKRFEFSDLLMNGDLDSLNKFCDLLIKHDLGITWGGQATVREDMREALFKKLKKAGCGGMTFGCESFSDKVLRLMRKGNSVNDAKGVLMMAKQADMKVEINLIVGFPGETEEDVGKTINFIRENRGLIDKINSLNICNIEPGMYIFEHLEEYNIDKSILFNNRYAWCTRDKSNTIEIRLARHKKLIEACSELGLKPLWQNAQRQG